MAEEILVKDALSDEQIEAGRRLVIALDDTELKPQSAFWFYLADQNSWRLILSSALVRERGPKEAYRIIQSALEAVSPGDSVLSLREIGVAVPENRLVRLMTAAVTTPADALIGARFSKNVINGEYIEDAYIYRMSNG